MCVCVYTYIYNVYDLLNLIKREADPRWISGMRCDAACGDMRPWLKQLCLHKSQILLFSVQLYERAGKLLFAVGC